MNNVMKSSKELIEKLHQEILLEKQMIDDFLLSAIDQMYKTITSLGDRLDILHQKYEAYLDKIVQTKENYE